MAIRFQSRATADVLMLDAVAERLLTLMGKTPAPQGIVTVAQLAAARAALQAAVLQSEAPSAAPPAPATSVPSAALARGRDDADDRDHRDDRDDRDDRDGAPAAVVSLRQRAAPLLALLAEAERADCDVTWTR